MLLCCFGIIIIIVTMHVRFPEGQIDVVVIVLINLIFEHICCVNKALLYTYTISSLSSVQVLLSNILLF